MLYTHYEKFTTRHFRTSHLMNDVKQICPTDIGQRLVNSPYAVLSKVEFLAVMHHEPFKFSDSDQWVLFIFWTSGLRNSSTSPIHLMKLPTKVPLNLNDKTHLRFRSPPHRRSCRSGCSGGVSSGGGASSTQGGRSSSARGRTMQGGRSSLDALRVWLGGVTPFSRPLF